MEEFFTANTSRLNEKTARKYRKLFLREYFAEPAEPYMSICDIPHELPYCYGSKLFKPNIAIGQRKLFLCELMFLTDYAINDNEICIYVGAAPSIHTGFLAALFPNVKFILIDSGTFDVRDANPVVVYADKYHQGCQNQHHQDHSIDAPADITLETAFEIFTKIKMSREQIFIINTAFTNTLARAAAIIIPQCLFISDIRTNQNLDRPVLTELTTNLAALYNQVDLPTDLDILWNLSQQYNWVKIIQPKMSMLKFRHPFREGDSVLAGHMNAPYAADFSLSHDFGIDFVKDFIENRLTYFGGMMRLQSFGPVSTTETRLITDGKNISVHMSTERYESKLFYHNSIHRGYILHNNDNSREEIGFDHCYDCALENIAWKKYIEVFDGEYNVVDYVNRLSELTMRSLLCDNHGRLFSRYPIDNLINAAKKHMSDPRSISLIYPDMQSAHRKK